MKSYKDASLSPKERAALLLSEMTLSEKLFQLESQLLFPNDFDKRRYDVGSVRNFGHFMSVDGYCKPSKAAAVINEDTRKSIEQSRLGIPVLQNGEALHGAQWCSGTCFPQAISMAATFDPELIEQVGAAVGKELRAGGVRQVFAPVVNLVRDCRWGRTEESFGEDVYLVSRIGAAYAKGLESQNVVSTPKHFVDNYADGGRDSNSSHTSWRALREVYLEPFRACFQDAGARSTMLAYNAVDDVPCSCNEVLMQDILRDEWGFDGFTVSDYGGVEGVNGAHRVAKDDVEAQAVCLKAGLDVDLPNGNGHLAEALQRGILTEADVDKAVLRLLQVKFELGLFENPYVDADKADEIVRSPEHEALSLRAAEKGMVLLKNDGLFPLRKNAYRRIGLFGPSVTTVNVGGYSGPYGGWKGEAETPYDALRKYLGSDVELVLCEDADRCAEIAKGCDLALYFTATLEGEGSDRCSLFLPAKKKQVQRSEGGAMIIGETTSEITVDQEKMLSLLTKTGVPLGVILINGAPVDVSRWIDGANAVLEAWYPGDMGSEAIVRTLYGENNPGGRLPMTFPLEIGQVPLFYARKPTGRGFGYIENDGGPRWPFGYGLSYTTFRWTNFQVEKADKTGVRVSLDVTNEGALDGDEVVQLYIGQTNAEVTRPMKELKAVKRVTVPAGATRRVTLTVDERGLSFWDRKMSFGVHACHCQVTLGKNSDDAQFTCGFDC